MIGQAIFRGESCFSPGKMMPVDLSEALEEHRRGNIERAARVYQMALAENPDHPDALHLLGVVAVQQGDPKRAELLIGRAAALRPGDAAIHANLGEVYRLLGDDDRAIECCRTALRIQPNYPEVHSNLGLALVRRGDLNDAIGHFREAIRLKPDFTSAHYSLGEGSGGPVTRSRLSFISARPCCSIPRRPRLDATWAEHSWSKVRTRRPSSTPGRPSAFALTWRKPTTTWPTPCNQSAGSTKPRLACSSRYDSIRIRPGVTPAWPTSGNSSASLTGARFPSPGFAVRSSPCRRAGPARDTSSRSTHRSRTDHDRELARRPQALTGAPHPIAIRPGSGARCQERV